MTSSFAYSAYGLGIYSTLPLPGFNIWRGKPDLQIRHEQLSAELQKPEQPTRWPGLHLGEVTPEVVTASVPGMAEIVVRRGCEVSLRLSPDADLHLMQLMLCGPVLSIALYQRGAVVLHASAVDVEGGAVLFCGESGWGKSSLAAALQTRGHRILCDDVTALLCVDGEVLVPAGSGQVKLGADVVETLQLGEDHLTVLHPDSDKQAYREGSGGSDRLVPLRRIYFLEPSSETDGDASHALPPMHGVAQLLRFSYGIHRLASATVRESYFQRCAAVTRSAGMFRLERKRHLASLPALAARIEAELRVTPARR